MFKYRYIIFLTGIGNFSADELSSGEEEFLDRLEQEQPQCITVRDVFPYSAANQNVGGQQVFEFLWRVTEKAEGWSELTQYLLEFRNIWRMAISADDRYGRIYNSAIALSIVVFDGNEGFDAATHVYHFRGDRDWTENIGGIVFPSRWLWTVGSPYNRARRERRYISYNSGSHQHSGDEGYFGQEMAEDGKTYVELTLEQVNRLPIWRE